MHHHHHHAVGVLPIQIAVANASPSAWQDLIVIAVGDGWIEAVSIHDDSTRLLATTARLAVGEPISTHPVAELLSIGAERHSGRVLPQ